MPEQPAQARAVLWPMPLAIAVGCAALAARSSPGTGALLATVVAGVLGGLLPVPGGEAPRASTIRWLGALGLGVAALVIGRLIRAPVAASPVTAFAVAANILAAVSEELFFRRLMYAWLVRWGPALAIAATAAAFALVHVRAYGILVLPIDAAAGVLFGWQRWASGGWSAPAVTHALANLLP
ncbi:MAG TPA: CPBP family intramembrane glutamic endopeptidase [bacterium]|nr:CPBP family intramembrane glutamic endopeptidase [bacterium]